jgi:hypothetical protein
MESEMARTHHLSMTGAVIICLVSTQGNGTLFASEDEGSLREAPSSQSLTSSASETQMSTSGGLVPERAPFTPSAGGFTANPSLGLVAPGAHRTFGLAPTESSALARQIYPGRPYRIRRDGSIAALMIGAVATIAGASVLVYAHRPECESNHFAGGCGYGTKVVGGAVLTGGIVGLFVGALTWR